MNKMNGFKFVSLERLHKEMKKREREPKKSTKEQFLAFDPFSRTFIAVDNRSYDFFMEEFDTHDEAVQRLLEC